MNRFSFPLILAICLLLAARCGRNPYAATNKLYKKQAKALARTIRKTPLTDTLTGAGPWIGTTNFNLRKPNFVVIHHTAQNSCAQTLKTFTLQKTEVSAHYLICRDGTIHHMLNDYLRAWHGGAARWGNVTDLNSSSIGIELDNNGSEPFAPPQIGSLLRLLDALKSRYGIPAANFIGHADIAPARKVDPSSYFPWNQLAAAGFGQWYGDTACLQVPEAFSHKEALRLVGYDTRDTLAAIRAFRLHFLQDTGRIMDEPARKILYSLSRLAQ